MIDILLLLWIVLWIVLWWIYYIILNMYLVLLLSMVQVSTVGRDNKYCRSSFRFQKNLVVSFIVCMYVRTYCTVGTIPAGQTARLTLSNIHLCAIRFLNLLQTNT